MNINVLDLSLACLSIEKEAFTRSDSHDVRRQRKYSDTFLKPMLDSLSDRWRCELTSPMKFLNEQVSRPKSYTYLVVYNT